MKKKHYVNIFINKVNDNPKPKPKVTKSTGIK